MKKIKYLIVFVFTFILVITNYNAYTCSYSGDINEHKEWYEKIYPTFGIQSVEDYVKNITIKVNANSITYDNSIVDGTLDKILDTKFTDNDIYKKAFNGKCQSKIMVCAYSFDAGGEAGAFINSYALFDDGLEITKEIKIERNKYLNKGELATGDAKTACTWYSYSKDGSDKPSQDVVYECDSYSTLKTDLEEKHKTYNDCKKDDNKVCNTSYEEYLTSKEKIKNYCNDVFANLSANSSCSKSCLTLSTTIKELEKIDTNGGECGLSGNLIKWIKNILKWIKYILPVLVIILGIIDFIRAIASGSDDEMKKAQGRFIKRLIAAALLFIIPALIEFILNVFNIESTFCGLTD